MLESGTEAALLDSASDVGSDAPATCSIGEVASEATADNLSLFGTPVYFNNGNPIPAGTYEVSYVDGCFKYASEQAWTVNAYDGGCCSWWLVGDTTNDQKLVLPGTIGISMGAGGFDNFDQCIAASQQTMPKRFDHPGGKLGIWLKDSNYGDNVAGMDGRNPKWRLTRIGACVDGGSAADGSSD